MLRMVYLGKKSSPFRKNQVVCFQKYGHLVFETEDMNVFKGLLDKRMQDIDIFLLDEASYSSNEEKERVLEIVLDIEAKKEKCLIFVVYRHIEDNQKYVKSLKARTFAYNSNKFTHEAIKFYLSEYLGIPVEELERRQRSTRQIKQAATKPENMAQLDKSQASESEQPTFIHPEEKLDEAEQLERNFEGNREKRAEKGGGTEEAQTEEASAEDQEKEEPLSEEAHEQEIHRFVIPEHKDKEEEQEEYALNYANVYDMKEMTVYEIRGKDLTPEQKRKIKQLVRQRINRNETDFVQYPSHTLDIAKRKNVAIINLFHRSGASFLMYNLAVAVANEFQIPVLGVEAIQPKPKLYHALKIQPTDNWQCPYEAVLKKRALYHHHLYEKYGVKWLPQAPHSLLENRDEKILLDHEELVYLYMMACDYPLVLTDISSAFECGFTHQVVLDMADEVWIIANGDLLDLSYAYNKLQHYKKYIPHDNFFCIVNFHHNHIKTKTYVKYLGHVPLTVIPYDEKVATKAQQNPFVYQYPELGAKLLPAFEPLFERLIKPEALKEYRQNRKKHFFDSLLGLKG